MRLGDLLVRNGLITEDQRRQILLRQREDPSPFGALAERMFGVRPSAVEAAWAEQFQSIAPLIDPRHEPVDPAVLALVDRRQAWQFRVLPLRDDGEDIVVCTTREHLVRALKFTGWRIARSCHFLLAEPHALGEALMRYYRLPGMTAEMVSAGPAAAR